MSTQNGDTRLVTTSMRLLPQERMELKRLAALEGTICIANRSAASSRSTFSQNSGSNQEMSDKRKPRPRCELKTRG
jgi:hypothetical protein